MRKRERDKVSGITYVSLVNKRDRSGNRILRLYDMRADVEAFAAKHKVTMTEACVMLITWGLEADKVKHD